MIFAAVAGEDFLIAVAIDVGDPEGMAVGQSVVDDDARAEFQRALAVFASRRQRRFRATARRWR